ncbi:unnamed protein product [Durusdinium trenchii]|uniref:Protein xylosyltransferase n=1 Tax=Durusdinium trenchii TaxID=1381693 RepID=A0ABP0RXT9_9DINO
MGRDASQPNGRDASPGGEVDIEETEDRARAAQSRRPKRCDAISARSVGCYLVSFCATLYLAGIQTEVSVLNGVPGPPIPPTNVDSGADTPQQTPPPLQLESPAPESPARSEMSPERLEAREVKTTETQATEGPAASVEMKSMDSQAEATDLQTLTTSSPSSEIGYLLPRSGGCPKGAQQVDNFEECLAAAEYLKKKMMSKTPFNAHTDPPGCIYRATDRDIFFNSREKGGEVVFSSERKPVCKGKVDSVGASGKLLKPVAAWDQAPEDVREEAAKIRLFCFAWTPFRGGDEAVLSEVTKQYSKCDGHAFFSDRHPHGEERNDVIIVKVPEQRVSRSDGMWLYHRNMVGLMPSWDHMLRTGLIDDYDWVINSELDHFMSPSRCRLAIVSYLRTLRKGMSPEQHSVNGPLMLMWGNAFVFNKKMIHLMREQWKSLGTTESAKSVAVGCPQFMRGRQEWPDHCSQDIVYPNLVSGVMRGGVVAYGRAGCGQADATTRNNIPFQLGCWEMQHNPYGMSEEGEIEAITEFAHIQKLKDLNDAVKRYASTDQAENHKLWYSAKNVPVIHHIVSAEVHRIARELLDPEPEKVFSWTFDTALFRL